MPIFEYKCNSCGVVSEFLEKTSARKKYTCPKCGNKDMQKLMSGFAVGQSSQSAGPACDNCMGDQCGSAGCCPYSEM